MSGRSLCVAALAAAGFAALVAAPAAAAGLDQIWIGGLAHDVVHQGGDMESGTQDVSLELDSRRPSILRPLGAPRVGLALAANSAGHSSLASLSLVWDRRLAGRLYGTFDFGLGVTNGLVGPRAGAQGVSDFQHRLLLGSHVLFREAVGLEWRLSPRWSLGAEFIHASNGDLLGSHHYNRGINDAGLRLGYRFD